MYVGGTPDQVIDRFASGDEAWCGMASLLKPRSCHLQLSPFTTRYAALRKVPNLGGLHDSFVRNTQATAAVKRTVGTPRQLRRRPGSSPTLAFSLPPPQA